jgi:1,4-alpha-glucan branching enzyme
MRHRCIIRLLIFIPALVILSGCASSLHGPEATDSGIRFTLHAPGASSVALSGSFNRWSAISDPLGGPDKNGVWSLVKPLPPGRYEYRFIVNNRDWILDPEAPSVDDGLGERNSAVIVSPWRETGL